MIMIIIVIIIIIIIIVIIIIITIIIIIIITMIMTYNCYEYLGHKCISIPEAFRTHKPKLDEMLTQARAKARQLHGGVAQIEAAHATLQEQDAKATAKLKAYYDKADL